MTRQEAETLADRVREFCEHSVIVSADGEAWVVQVARSTERGLDTFTLYGASDWEWLRDRITS